MVISKGNLGVNFFFVLSGFLITYLILFEFKAKGSFGLKNFLIRRSLRIWPLYFLIVAIGFILFPLLDPTYETMHNVWNYVFFLANFDEIIHGLNDGINFLTAPWSVAVEEQFYLFWGISLFLLFKVKKFKLSYLLFSIWLISLIFTYMNLGNDRVLYYHTLSVMSNIVIGGFLAVLYFNKTPWLLHLKKLSRPKIFIIYLLGLIIILIKNKLFIGYFEMVEQSVISLFFAFVIFEQIYLDNSFFKVGKIKIFNQLGKISYGLYLFHLVNMYLIQLLLLPYLMELGLFMHFISLITLASLGTYLMAYISYYYFEKPFLKIKENFT